MKSMTGVSFLLKLLLIAIWIPSGFCIAEDTRIDLTEPDTGRKICSAVLKEGEQVVPTWMNSLFSLRVTEVFEARSSALLLTEVTYASPQGPAPPIVSPEDVEELQTGGPFHAWGPAKPFRKII